MMLAKACMFVAVTSFCLVFEGAAIASPKNDNAIIVLEAAIKSLKDRPNQFNRQVTCQAMQATSNGAGTAVHVSVVGGGTNSHTTGLNVTMDNAQCSVAESKVDAAMKEQGEKAIELLTRIKSALEAPKVDKSSVSDMLSELGNTFVVPALQSVIDAVVKKRLGLP